MLDVEVGAQRHVAGQVGAWQLTDLLMHLRRSRLGPIPQLLACEGRAGLGVPLGTERPSIEDPFRHDQRTSLHTGRRSGRG